MTRARTAPHRASPTLGVLLLALLGLSACQDAAPPTPAPSRNSNPVAHSDAPPTCTVEAQHVAMGAAGARGTVALQDGAQTYTRADGTPLALRPEDLRLAQADDGTAQAWLGYGAELIPITDPACLATLQPLIGGPDATAVSRSDEWADAMRARHAAGDQAGMVTLLQEAAEARLDWAMTALGLSLLRGDGIAADQAAAIHWFQQAARQSHPEALYQLGGLYAQGAAGAEGEARVLHLLTTARALGHAKAAAMLQAIGR